MKPVVDNDFILFNSASPFVFRIEIGELICGIRDLRDP